jgi:hypothetical protein
MIFEPGATPMKSGATVFKIGAVVVKTGAAGANFPATLAGSRLRIPPAFAFDRAQV